MRTDGRKDFKRFAGIFTGIVTAVLIGCIMFVVITDPFYHYHAPWFGLPVVMEEAVYQTPGAARNLEYSDVILGSSMTENFHASWFDEEMGWDTIKLSYSGARSDDLKAILELIFAREEPPKHVFMDINEYQLTVPSWTAYVERPKYLYDGSVWNDYPYLINRDVLARGYERVLDGIQGRKDNLDTAYVWEDESYFGREVVLAKEEKLRNELLQQFENAEATDAENSGETLPPGSAERKEERLTACRENLDNLLPFIEQNPDTEFLIFFPPYSMLYWEQKILQRDLEGILEVYYDAVKEFLQYENVKVYYFQDEKDIITELDHYRDATHFRPEYNRYIFETVRDGGNNVTLEETEERMRNLYYFVRGYDYQTAYWQGVTLDQ